MELPSKHVTITTERTNRGFFGLLDQGAPEFPGAVNERKAIAHAFNLEPYDLHPDLLPEIVSTGLRYLIVPVQPGALKRARILQDITTFLHRLGSAIRGLAGSISVRGAALEQRRGHRRQLRHELARGNEIFLLHQGRFTGRPSQLRVQAEGTPALVSFVKVGGDVAPGARQA